MPKQRTIELYRCRYFTWKLCIRKNVWQADGRSNPVFADRHSLGTRERTEALENLEQLDRTMAVQQGLARPNILTQDSRTPLPLLAGRELYKNHIGRPEIIGGVRASSAKRYRAVLDKFLVVQPL